MGLSNLDRVKRVLNEELGVKEEEIVESALFTEDLGADSPDMVELIMAFEDEFSIEIPDDEAIKVKSVGDLLALVERRS